jgi:hypothetical protein
MHANRNSNVEESIPLRIGTITILSVRNFILDSGLSNSDAVLLNTVNFDDIVLEYRETYRQSIPIPFYLLEILVVEDESMKKSMNRIKASRNDRRRFDGDYLLAKVKDIQFSHLTSNDMRIYRCGWCGNVVDYNGAELSSESKLRKFEVLKKFEKQIEVIKVNGRCCPEGSD